MRRGDEMMITLTMWLNGKERSTYIKEKTELGQMLVKLIEEAEIIDDEAVTK